MTHPLRLLGLDIAALYSGAAVVETEVVGGSLQAKVREEMHLRTERIAAAQPPSWESMNAVAETTVKLVKSHDVTHVIYEGYAKGSFGGKKKKDGTPGKGSNTTAYEQAELVGVIKRALDTCGRPLIFLQVPVTTLSSFYGLTKGDKTATQRMLKETLGWESFQRYTKWRGDCADAVAHAYLGAHVFSVIDGWDPTDIQDSMRRVIYGDTKKSGMVGLLHRPHLYIPRTACLSAIGDDDDPTQED